MNLNLTTSEAEALMHKVSGGPLTPQDERLLPIVSDRLLGAYRAEFRQPVAFLYVGDDDEEKFARTLRDPFGRDGLS